jgi:hypothetical protein
MATENGDNSAHLTQMDDLANVVRPGDQLDDEVSRRNALGRLAAYTAPAMLAILTSDRAFAIHSVP